MTSVNRLCDSYSINNSLERSYLFCHTILILRGLLGRRLLIISWKVFQPWHVSNHILIVVNDLNLAGLRLRIVNWRGVISLILVMEFSCRRIKICELGVSFFIVIELSWWLKLFIGWMALGFTQLNLYDLLNLFNLFLLSLNFFDRFLDLVCNALGKVLFLQLNHFVTHCAEIK